jgi:ubiquinone/menaquinone biosynthesis C-methylase UbiE
VARRRRYMTAQPQAPDLRAIKQRQQKAWSTGDYGKIGVPLILMAERLCEAVDLYPGAKVLDVACGNGNTALAAARRFGEVVGLDYVPMLLEEGKERARAEGLPIDFREGDAEDLPFEDASFDAVLSTLGVMFAPDQERAAGELLRVLKPGGKIGMANWTPDSFVGELFRTMGKRVPPPTGLKPPFLWGTQERVGELFAENLSELRAERRTFVFRYPSAEYYVEYMRDYYGPMSKAFEALDEEGQQGLHRDLVELVGRYNRSGEETAVWPVGYLEVVATKR